MTTTTEVKERPIIFSAMMVRAILEGRKTQTRRVLNPQPAYRGQIALDWIVDGTRSDGWFGFFNDDQDFKCPFGGPKDRLWVREIWAMEDEYPIYRADLDDWSHIPDVKWKSPLFMPHALARITLEITGIRVERLQDISWPDAISEGIYCDAGGKYRQADGVGPFTDDPALAYRWLWDSINAKRAPWSSNPWVWVISFSRGV